jgi:BirA family biotin operon repressor/biotin-[acetyl-CoA-carboxylase] ligase
VAADILSFLTFGEWVSGEEMAEMLGISRAAVWKQIQSLRQRGYEISASTRKGYRLAKKQDFLDADRICGSLKTKWLGRDMRILAKVSSTNEVALSLARDCPSGTVILAETQTQGRGRLSRSWDSPPGGIWMSLILKPEMPLAHVYQINMAVAVAVCKAISSSLGLEAGIKWPNDLLIEGQKICGILMEVSAQVDRLDYAVVGLGLNANNDPSGFPAEWRSTSLAAELGHDISRCELIGRILEEIEVAFEKMGHQDIYEEWRSRSLTLKRQVRITSAAGNLVGEVVDLAEDGALLLLSGDEQKRVLAGDCIHLRAADPEGKCELGALGR